MWLPVALIIILKLAISTSLREQGGDEIDGVGG